MIAEHPKPLLASRRVARLALGALSFGAVSCEPAPLPDPKDQAASHTKFAGSEEWSRATRTRIQASEYAPFKRDDVLQVANPAQRFRADFGNDFVRLTGHGAIGSEPLSIHLHSWGRVAAQRVTTSEAPGLGACTPDGAVDVTGACIRRVEYERDGVADWWANTPSGLEFGFDITDRPPGEGPIVFVLDLPGAIVEVDGDGDGSRAGVVIGSTRWRCDRLSAWDITGRVLPVWMEASDGGLSIIVDDLSATGPIFVDPTWVPDWSVEGNDEGANLGSIATGLGDVNGDGYGDVMVGNLEYGTQDPPSHLYLYVGSAGGLSATATELPSPHAYRVAGVGDVNGDGYRDVIVGSALGGASVFLGSATGLTATPVWTQPDGTAPYGTIQVASAGDVNADGFGDVLLGYPGTASAPNGTAMLFFGSPTGPSTTPGWSFRTTRDNEGFGASVASAGDVNGDGWGDIVVGAPRLPTEDAPQDDRVYAFLGSAIGPSSTPNWTVSSARPESQFGASVSTAGDVNGDGYSDVVVGGFGLTSSHDGPGPGRATVYLGSPSGLASTATWSVEMPDRPFFGRMVASVGDMNGDGFGDIAVADDGIAGYGGHVSVYFGGTAGPGVTEGWSTEGESSMDGRSWVDAMASAGDVNGDGLGDLIFGNMAFSDSEPWEGGAFVYLGATGVPSTTPGWTVSGDHAGSAFATSIAGAGDIDGDGFGDVIVGAPSFDGASSDEGRAYLYLGTAGGLSPDASWIGGSAQAGGAFGAQVASAGDVDGDGFADVVVGAPGEGDVVPGAGRVYGYAGSAEGLSDSPTWVAEGTHAHAGFGEAVARAGDVNGDGFDDVLLGAPGDSTVAADGGRVLLYAGSAVGLGAEPAWEYVLDHANAALGTSVAGTGDIDGDGFADVVVGAPGFDDAGANQGEALVFRGSPVGLGSSPSWVRDGQRAGTRFGAAVAGLGDTNGDGFADFAVGSPGADRGLLDVGQVDVFLGSAIAQSAVAPWTQFGRESGSSFGATISSAGDVDGDGFADVLIGGSGSNSVPARVSLFRGGSTGPEDEASWDVEGPRALGFGEALASVGDVDADGFGDVAIGANADDEGKACVYYGNSDATNAPGVSVTLRTLQPGLDEVVSPGLVSEAGDRFSISMRARSPTGREQLDLELEVKPLGVTFDGTGLQTLGARVDSGVHGATVNQVVQGLAPARGYHWRARVRGTTVGATPQVWGLWKYGGLSGSAALAHVFTSGGLVYRDGDGDGYGDPASGRDGRGTSDGYVEDATDCDDRASNVHPGATEVCDASDVDEDCDGLSDDEDVTVDDATKLVFFADADSDGYGTSQIRSCNKPAAYAEVGGDCDDSDATVRPNGRERCDAGNADEDCDGLSDDADLDPDGRAAAYVDADRDGFPGTAAGQFCDPPAASSPIPNDCDDNDAGVHPGADEQWGDGVDSNCDGQAICFVDGDGDGYRSNDGALVISDDRDCTDPGEASDEGPYDCNDVSAEIHPGAVEADCADPTDYNCDGSSGWVDEDLDGVAACNGDCDDWDFTVAPGRIEICNSLDDDCDGQIDDNTDELCEEGISVRGGMCGCSSTPQVGAWLVFVALAGALARHRRRHAA